MTDSDIIKALECCTRDGECSACPMRGLKTIGCVERLIVSALDLIKRQQAEIERLEGLATNMEYCANHALDEIEKEKREAIKDFAERLKEKAYTAENEWSRGGHPLVVEVDDIDELVAEMEGEK